MFASFKAMVSKMFAGCPLKSVQVVSSTGSVSNASDSTEKIEHDLTSLLHVCLSNSCDSCGVEKSF